MNRRAAVLAPALVAALLLPACRRETRQFLPLPLTAAAAARAPRNVPLHAGTDDSFTTLPETAPRTDLGRAYLGQAYDLNEGKRLFEAYNCTGCHGHGGGSMGPALMDHRWIYGARPVDVYNTIVRGRSNGMPSFSGRIPQTQVWQIVAYVLSMSGNAHAVAAPGRSDHMDAWTRAENSRTRETPQGVSQPPLRHR